MDYRSDLWFTALCFFNQVVPATAVIPPPKPSKLIWRSRCSREKQERFYERPMRSWQFFFTQSSTFRKQIITGCITSCSIMLEVQRRTVECIIIACAAIVKWWLYSMIIWMTDVGIFSLAQWVIQHVYFGLLLLNTSLKFYKTFKYKHNCTPVFSCFHFVTSHSLVFLYLCY